MAHVFKVFALFLCLTCSFVMASEEKLSYVAPSQLPNTTSAMQSAGFWIARHPTPDEIILSAQDIATFNLRTQNDLKLTKDIFAITANFQTESLITDFDRIIADVTGKGYYTLEGERDNTDFLDKARRNMNLSGVVLGISPRYGVTVRYANVRFLPTDKGLYESMGDVDFDQLQNSSLDIGSPVAIVHQSLDKKWYYVLSALSDGWVEADRIALGDGKAIRELSTPKDFIVTVVPKADIFLNEQMTQFYDHVRMGTRLSLVSISDEMAIVLVPTLDNEGKLQIVSGYMNVRDVHEGYLPYSARSIYTQAFAMLNEPYGWGGMYRASDCSAFLDEVFNTVGVALPRDSKNQALVGSPVAIFDDKSMGDQRLQALSQAVGGATILPMKGHIMLYLGQIDSKPYVIQAIWAYREHKGDKDIPRVINRVVVSDLSLGDGSFKGSLLKRLTKVIQVK